MERSQGLWSFQSRQGLHRFAPEERVALPAKEADDFGDQGLRNFCLFLLAEE